MDVQNKQREKNIEKDAEPFSCRVGNTDSQAYISPSISLWRSEITALAPGLFLQIASESQDCDCGSNMLSILL